MFIILWSPPLCLRLSLPPYDSSARLRLRRHLANENVKLPRPCYLFTYLYSSAVYVSNLWNVEPLLSGVHCFSSVSRTVASTPVFPVRTQAYTQTHATFKVVQGQSRVACRPLVSHVEYVTRALFTLPSGWAAQCAAVRWSLTQCAIRLEKNAPCAVLTLEKKDETDRLKDKGTDRRQTVTLCLPLDAASVVNKYILKTVHC